MREVHKKVGIPNTEENLKILYTASRIAKEVAIKSEEILGE